MDTDKIRLLQSFLQLYILDRRSMFLYPVQVANVHYLLNGVHVIVVLLHRIVAEDVHIESSTFLDHGGPNTTRTDDRDGLASNFIAQERKKGMPRSPFLFAYQPLARPK